MTRALLIAGALLSTLSGSAQPRMPASTSLDLEQLASLAKQETDARKLTAATHGRFPTAYMNGRCMVGFLGKVTASAPLMEDSRISWGARAGDVISFRVDAHHLDLLHSLSLSYAQLALIRHRMLDRVVRDTRADSVQQGINLPQAYTGRNTILGIVDAGFDYGHPMFFDTAMSATRVLAAWDQNKLSGPAPLGYAYGTVHDGAAALLAAQCDTVDSWGLRDFHGTHVAGIAGGGGAGTLYRGLAFDSEFLFVSMGTDDAALLDGFAWMRDRALQEGKRLVVNCSWGARSGPMDGTGLLDQAMDQLSGQGVLFVCANGNYGDVDCHIKRDFTGDTLRTRAAFSNASYPQYAGQSLLLWGESGAPFSASIALTNTASTTLAATPWYQSASGPAFVDSALVSGNDTIHFSVAYEAAHPLNGRPFMRFIARRSSTLVKLALRITAPSGAVHAWNDESFIGGMASGGTPFQAPLIGWTAGDRQSTVIDPACANSVIGVGAHAPEDGGSGGFLAGFSSRGPTIDGRLKPDITAPGVGVASSVNSCTSLSFDQVATVQFDGLAYPFGRLSGTSMATPAVSGCAALLLEASPFATPAQIKAALLDNARTDGFTGNVPPQGSTAWGRGKVNAYAAMADLLGVVGVEESDGATWRVWPNPVTGLLRIEQGITGFDEVSLMDATGRVLARRRSTTEHLTIDMQGYAPGTYLLLLKAAGATYGQRIVRE